MPDEALIRWGEIRREHLSGAIAYLGLSTGSLAFCGSLLKEDSVQLGGERTTYFLTAVVFFIAALVVSLIVTLTRLQDVRITAQIIRKRNNDTPKSEVENLRRCTRCWGTTTWWLFRLQLLAFSGGACFLLVARWHIFHGKLFP